MLQGASGFSYYFQVNGTPNEDVLSLKDCFEKCVYLVAKYKYRIPDMHYFFSNDITFCFAWYDDGRIKDFWVNEPPGLGEVFNIKRFEVKGPEAVSTLEGLLNQGEIVMVQTFNERLPFWKQYQPDFKPENYRPAHAFLIIGHDQENYYYVDEKRNINLAGFIPYELNEEVGVIKKKEMRPALEFYLRYYTVSANISEPADFDSRFEGVIHKIIKNYHKSREVIGDVHHFYGKETFQQLIAICEAEKTHTNDEIFILNNTIPLQELLRWKVFLDVINRRKLLQKSFLLYFKRKGLNASEKFFTILVEINHSWEKLRNRLEYKYLRKSYLLDAKIGEYFKEIMNLEDQFVKSLAAYFS